MSTNLNVNQYLTTAPPAPAPVLSTYAWPYDPEYYVAGGQNSILLPGPQLSGTQSEFQDTVIRSQMDTGPGKARRRFTGASEYLSVVWMYNTRRKLVFEAWFKFGIRGGAPTFDLPHPWTNIIKKARFKKPPTIVPEGNPHLRHDVNGVPYLDGLWKISAELELLP